MDHLVVLSQYPCMRTSRLISLLRARFTTKCQSALTQHSQHDHDVDGVISQLKTRIEDNWVQIKKSTLLQPYENADGELGHMSITFSSGKKGLQYSLGTKIPMSRGTVRVE